MIGANEPLSQDKQQLQKQFLEKMNQNTQMAKALGILNGIDFQVTIKSKKKGRPFMDSVLENTPE